jgi:GTPase SAR1 family protein
MTSTATDTRAAVVALVDRAMALAANGPLAAEAAAIRERLEGPLRVAIAGRVKAGKSTLLNALVGERLAPTDAGECTRFVSTYHEGLGYAVLAILKDGTSRPLPFRRSDGALEIELDGAVSDSVDRLDVAWPSSALRRMTLIDTPGLASINDENSVRTREFLALGEDRSSDADAVIYLMRHLHRTDADFLDAFLDRSVGNVSPVNAIAILSRADEIGAGRLDAMESARRIAERYRTDEDLRALCGTVIPMAGLLAETGQTLREEEAAALRALAALRDDSFESLLLSADRFASPAVEAVGVEMRRHLLGRLGMYGVRLTLTQLRAGRVSTASDLAALLVEASGLQELRRLLAEHFMPRAQQLKSRSAVAAVRRLSRRLASTNPDGARELDAEAERIEAGAREFAELRLAHLALSRAVKLSTEETEEVARLTGPGDAARRLGLPAEADPAVVTSAALAGIERWRGRAEDPLADRLLVEAAEIVVRSYEGIYAAARAA